MTFTDRDRKKVSVELIDDIKKDIMYFTDKLKSTDKTLKVPDPKDPKRTKIIPNPLWDSYYVMFKSVKLEFERRSKELAERIN